MSDVSAAVKELSAALGETDMPREFLDRFDLLECLAHSHGTETFLAVQKGTQMLCVAKLYDRGVYKTVSESGILKGLCHDGLPSFVGEYQNNAVTCVVREYIEGTPLDKYLTLVKPTQKQMVGIAEKLCDILSYLHGLEPPIIHRDIKPQNVIVRDDGSVCLIDFDAARLYARDAETDTQLIGTRTYAPPEQYGFSQTDRRADIYSFGVLLCYMLTGSADTKQAKIDDKRLAAVVRRCTAFSPEERYSDVAAVKKALRGNNARRRSAIKRILVTAALCLLALCAGFAAGRYTNVLSPPIANDSVSFREPLIERAVRVQLGKDDSESITPDELLSVREIYIFGEEVAKNEEPFSEGLGGSLQYAPRGGITSLEDVRMLPNLEVLYVNYQTLSNISPVAELERLTTISLRSTYVEDISALAGMKHLGCVVLFDTNVSEFAALEGSIGIQTLDVGKTCISSIDDLPELPELKSLSLRLTTLTELDGIERFAALERLDICRTEFSDLSPLIALPHLSEVSISESRRDMAEALEQPTFTFNYEQP